MMISSRGRGFVLVELLVVIGIIALVAGLLLPGMMRVKGNAKTIGCINNERQLSMAWMLYSTDNNDKLPANGIPIRVPVPNIKWVQGAFIFAEDATNSDWILDPKWALFAKYIGKIDTYLCPNDPPTVSYMSNDYPRLRSYAMNNYIGWEGFLDDSLDFKNYKVLRKATEIVSPSGIFLIQDVYFKSICWPYFGTYMNKESFFNFPSSAHQRAGVISFADTHVARHRWNDERTIKAESSNYHAHDDASPNNADLQWLQQHATIAK
jgi:type II secretory pathway pseudopilin PulG